MVNDDDNDNNDGAWVYYKLTYEPLAQVKGSGELTNGIYSSQAGTKVHTIAKHGTYVIKQTECFDFSNILCEHSSLL